MHNQEPLSQDTWLGMPQHFVCGSHFVVVHTILSQNSIFSPQDQQEWGSVAYYLMKKVSTEETG